MKTYHLLFLLFGLPISLSAQDVIVKKDGTKIEAKVLEISTTTVRYRNFTQPEGPDRTIAIGSLKEIVYEDGQFDDFSKVPEASSPPAQPAPINPNSMGRPRLTKDPFLSSGIFIDGLIGFAELDRIDDDYYYDYLMYPNGTDPVHLKTNYLSLGFRFGTKWYFGQREQWSPGLQMNWVRLGLYVNPNDLGNQNDTHANLSFCNIGMTNIFKFNDNIGLELNFTTGFNLNPGSESVLGLNFAPEVKLRLKKLAIGLDYSYIRGFHNPTMTREDILNQLSISIGVKF